MLEQRCLLAATPLLSIGDGRFPEGTGTVSKAFLDVTLSTISDVPVTVNYTTQNGSAIRLLDYNAVSRKLTIPAGAASGRIWLSLVSDSLDEPNETFKVVLSAPVGAAISKATGVVTIVDDDPPALSISSATIAERSQGATVQLTVQASSAVAVPMSVTYRTRNSTAIYGLDYRAASGTITIPAGSTSAFVTLKVLDDSLYEAAESFEVVLSSPVNATIAQSIGRVTITDNDLPPIVSIADAAIREGSTNSTVIISLDRVSGVPVTVTYQTVQNTARAVTDYPDQTGTVTIPAGQLSAEARIATRHDSLAEPDKAFRLVLSDPLGATLGRSSGIVTILDDDRIEQPLFEMRDMVYLGGFRIPTGQFGSTSFEFGGNALTFNSGNNSLFMAANANFGLHVAEVAIPALRNDGKSGPMPIARVQQPFVNLGTLLTVNAAGRREKPKIDYENLTAGGLLVANGSLTGSMYMGYNGAEPQASMNSHFRTTGLNLASLTSSTFRGLIDIRRDKTATDARSRAGYMAEVPLAWRPWIGAPHVTGAAGQNRIQFSSSGPALFGFNAASPAASSLAPLVSYPSGHALEWSNSFSEGPKPLFNGTTKVDGVTFVPGTRSVLFMGSSGQSSIGYGDGSLFNDKARPYSGYHSQAGKYAYQIWSYDINDFMAVRNGTKAAWELRPTNVFNFELPVAEPAKYLGGIAFDPLTSRLYVSQKLAGPGYTPVIHVYQLGRQTVAPSAMSLPVSGFTTSAASPAPGTRVSTSSTTSTYTTLLASGSTTNIPAAMMTSTTATTKTSSSSTSSLNSFSQISGSSLTLESIDQLFGSIALDLNLL